MSSRIPEPSRRPLLAVAAGGLVAAGLAGALLRRLWRWSEPDDAVAAASRGLRAGAAILATAVLLDSGIEHYRGSFENPAMIVAPTLALATLAAAAWPGRVATAVHSAALAVGAGGVGFHSYNVGKRVGGFDLQDFFYAAPIGAPGALSLAGLFGLASERFPARARLLAAVAALALIGTSAEAGLLHFRGAFQNPAMFAPLTVPPIAAASLAIAIADPDEVPVARALLQATALLGIAGPLFHAYGVHRNMGGWRNWSQMLLQGPPIPAPPAFLGVALAGLGLLPALERRL